MDSTDFWDKRLTATKLRLITNMIDYCDVYDILHDEVLNPDKVKRELAELIDIAVNAYVNDNYE